ncbi:MAG: hypothetical protein ACOX7A_02380 [Lawsonibacter sp.]
MKPKAATGALFQAQKGAREQKNYIRKIEPRFVGIRESTDRGSSFSGANEKGRYPSTLEVVDRAAETANCKSRSEYLERAALFYAGYISGQDATAYLPPALSKVMRGIVRDTENRICRMLFKLAVELDMVMNLLAAAMEIPEARLRELRVRCIENVKKTNGSITMEDAVAYQNGDK